MLKAFITSVLRPRNSSRQDRDLGNSLNFQRIVKFNLFQLTRDMLPYEENQ